MIINRFIGKYKQGMFEEGVAVLSTEVKRLLEKSGYGELRHARLLIPLEEENTIIGEYTFEDVAEKERFWAAWGADAEVPAFIEKHGALMDGGLDSANFEVLLDEKITS